MDYIKELQNLNNQQIYLFIHELIDAFCGISQIKSSKYVPNIWSTEEQFANICQFYTTFLTNLIDIRTNHQSLNAFPEEIQKMLIECQEVRRIELRKAIINNTIAENNPMLKDFYWKVNVVLGSDQMTQINEPLINLDLNINKAIDGTQTQDIVSLEWNREELSRVLKTLEEAQQQLKQSYI